MCLQALFSPPAGRGPKRSRWSLHVTPCASVWGMSVMLATWDLNRVWDLVIHPRWILTSHGLENPVKTDWWQSPLNGWVTIHHVLTHGIPWYKAFLDIHHVWDFPFETTFVWGLSIAMFDHHSGYQPSLRLGLPNHRRDAIGLHGSLEQLQSSWIPMFCRSFFMSNLSCFLACSQTPLPCFPKKDPKLTLKSPHHANAKQFYRRH